MKKIFCTFCRGGLVKIYGLKKKILRSENCTSIYNCLIFPIFKALCYTFLYIITNQNQILIFSCLYYYIINLENHSEHPLTKIFSGSWWCIQGSKRTTVVLISYFLLCWGEIYFTNWFSKFCYERIIGTLFLEKKFFRFS